VSCGGSPRSASEILNRLNEVSVNAVLLKELLRQVADPGNWEGAQRAGRRIHRIANEMLTEFGTSSKAQRGMGWQNCSIAARNI
jgi:NTE family protein